MDKLIVIVFGFLLSACNELVYIGDENPDYTEFTGHHVISCDNGLASGYLIERFEFSSDYSITSFNAEFLSCDFINLITIDYEYLYDFSVIDTDRDMERTGKENIIYRKNISEPEISDIYLRDEGFISNETFYQKINIEL